MAQELSQCNVCKQLLFETGNYGVTIHRARRVPKKTKTLKTDLSASAWGMNKFQKYLMKRAVPTNICEIKCGKCGTTCKIPMTKKKLLPPAKTPTPGSSFRTNFETSSIGSGKKNRRKSKNKNNEMNAGLLIPATFTPSTLTAKTSIATLGGSSVDSSGVNSHNRSKQARLLATRSILQRALFNEVKSNNTVSALDRMLQ